MGSTIIDDFLFNVVTQCGYQLVYCFLWNGIVFLSPSTDVLLQKSPQLLFHVDHTFT